MKVFGLAQIQTGWMKQVKNEKIEKATQLLKEGKTPTAVVAATGIGLTTASKILRTLRVENQSYPVTTRFINAEEIQKHGCPEKPLAKSPKEFILNIGSVAIEVAVAEVKDAVETILKPLGIKEIHIVLTTPGIKADV